MGSKGEAAPKGECFVARGVLAAGPAGGLFRRGRYFRCSTQSPRPWGPNGYSPARTTAW
jgi:hypothetical protein